MGSKMNLKWKKKAYLSTDLTGAEQDSCFTISGEVISTLSFQHQTDASKEFSRRSKRSHEAKGKS